MTASVNIRRALMGHLRSLNLGVPLLRENESEEPPESGIWIQPFFLPDTTTSCGKLRTDGDFKGGTFQVSLFTHIGSGTLEILQMADQINTSYYHGRQLTANGQVVQIHKVELEPGFRTGPYWHQPISIYYQTITSRN